MSDQVFVGLIRRPFLVPCLARVAVDAEPRSARVDAGDVGFEAFNCRLGVAVGASAG